MSNSNLIRLKTELPLLTVFHNLLKTEQLNSFYRLLKCEGSLNEKLELYGDFVSSLYAFNGSFSCFLKKAVSEDDNVYITLFAKGKTISDEITSNIKHELEVLSLLSCVTSEMLKKWISYDGYLPSFKNTETDFSVFYGDRCKNVSRTGYGIFATYPMFKVYEGRIVPVESYDETVIESFVGYEKERQAVIDNTKALVENKPAANVLLYGDAGTGKSSTVKAIANMFYDKGVRLIEIRKDQLLSLSDIMDKIADNPLKFIIFIDDLSFNKNDDKFSMLKAALEGSASVKASNAVIYATSNRRHIVKETFSDRTTGGDDIHRNDTVQELLSLSERFGLTVYFSKPNKILYLDIVHQLADRYGIKTDKAELDIKAEAFALNKGNRSPRAAEQFVKSLVKK